MFGCVAIIALILLLSSVDMTGDVTKKQCASNKKDLKCGSRSCGCVHRSASCGSFLCKGGSAVRLCPNEVFNRALHCPT